MPRMRELVGQVLKSEELSTVCTAYRNIKNSLATLDTLTPSTLQTLRWHIQAEARKEAGSDLADFLHALDAYIEKAPLVRAKQRDEKESYGMYMDLSPEIDVD